jgi:hypothetical protein
LLVLFGAFLISLTVARIYRFRTHVWVPGWTGGISLLVLVAVFFVLMLALGNPSWLEPLFFGVVGAVVGAYMSLARLRLEGAWWQIWR